ncbi:nucleoside phosphorylase domain-containing protein [Phaeosphaeria sp. MPI-PUGE-AT-0046c]|nr:nucleoside phosphorylase domain-containing protein [Phaeosphaeria sp. MPI-PUGE-AT-0046c]
MAHQLHRDKYTVGWVCALPVELAAAQEMLDEEHLDLERDPADKDENLYVLGTMSGHNVAIVCLPSGRIGNSPAAVVATQLQATFKSLRFGLMVGIGGGVPSADADIRLGDVVVSQPHHVHSGVVQYDAGKATLSGFERTGSLNSPPHVLLSAVAKVQANELRGRSQLATHASKLERIAKFQRAKAGPDVLFEAEYHHSEGQTCGQCSVDRHETRQPRDSEQEVVVHYGTIASGNQVIKSASERDRVSAELGGVLCFEMEAAGLMNSFPCLVVRGICDYADSHKNKQWQAYAAATASAWAKELLSVIPAAEIANSNTVEEAIQEKPEFRKETKGLLEERASNTPLNVQKYTLNQCKEKGQQFKQQISNEKSGLRQAAKQQFTTTGHRKPNISCKACAKMFLTQNAANEHMTATGHGSPNIGCKACDKKFLSQNAANEHMTATGHGSPSIPCKACAKMFLTQNAANEHMTATGHGSPNIGCKACDKKFLSQNAANEHITATGHGNPNISCRSKKCTKKFFTQSAMNAHVVAVKH